MADTSYDVYISYRRSTGSALAQLVRTALTKRGYRVFMDVRELSAGPFDAALKKSIETAENFVVLLTPGCLDRCADEKDWFRQEITLALNSKRNIVPLKTEDFQFPPVKDLPKAAALLTRHHCVTYVHEHSDASLDKLCQLLRRPRHAALRRWLAALTAAGLVLAGLSIWAGFRSRTGNAPPPPPSGPEPVELLALVDVNRDKKEGEWYGNKTMLVGKSPDKSFYLALPWNPPAEYLLKMRVTRRSLPDKCPLVIGLASGDKRFSILVDADTDSMHTGISVIDGRKFKGRNDTRKGRILNRGVPMDLTATVRPELIQLESNGTVIYEWRGDLSHISRNPREPTEPLVVGGRSGSFEFENIVLEPLGDDRGQPLSSR